MLRRGVGSGVGFRDCDLSLCGGIYLYFNILLLLFFLFK